jgi:NHLM bacteriocin system ABC transporter ATP-binding protein
MTAHRLVLAPGAARALPAGERPWRVRKGDVEVYLISPERRRLIAVAGEGEDIFPTAEGLLTLSVLATGTAELEQRPAVDPLRWRAQLAAFAGLNDPPWAADAGMAVCYAALDARFAEIDQARDDQLAEALRTQDHAELRAAGSTTAALADAAEALGVDSGGQALHSGPGEFEALPTLARLAGLRAAQVTLEPWWWRDDLGGPLIVRQADGSALGLHRAKGAWRDRRGVVADPAGCDSLAYRIFPPLDHDVSRLAGMARSVLRGIRSEIWLIAGAGLGAALAGLVAPLATGWVFDDVVPSGAGGLLIAAGVALLMAGLLTAMFSVVRALAVARVAGRGQSNMAAGIADRVLRLPALFFKSMSAADLNQRLSGLEGIRTLVTNTILNASLTLVFAVVYLILLFVYDVRMALAGLGLTLVYAAAVAASRMAQAGPLREAAERDGQLASLTFEILEGIPKLRSSAAEPRIFARWRRGYAAERAATARGERVGAHFAAFADSWRIVTLMGIFAVAILLVARDVRPGVFIAFLVAFAIFQASFAAFCEALLAIYAVRPQAERAQPIFSAAPETGLGRADPGRLTGDIQASGLSFAYSDGGAPLLDGLSFAVRPGEHLALVGGSGAGKSTILRLLLGFERPRTGSLTYDGQQLASLDPSRVRAQIGVVLQSSRLFAGSINDNIRGASGASLEQCRVAADRAGLGPDLKQMPMGLHTPITEGSDTLSGGQRQRILIARAIAAEPRILFFDEATSALDNATQSVVAQTLDSLHATRITIAHRLSTVRKADRICVLEGGRFVETGSYEELMARNGAFAALSRRQLLED